LHGAASRAACRRRILRPDLRAQQLIRALRSARPGSSVWAGTPGEMGRRPCSRASATLGPPSRSSQGAKFRVPVRGYRARGSGRPVAFDGPASPGARRTAARRYVTGTYFSDRRLLLPASKLLNQLPIRFAARTPLSGRPQKIQLVLFQILLARHRVTSRSQFAAKSGPPFGRCSNAWRGRHAHPRSESSGCRAPVPLSTPLHSLFDAHAAVPEPEVAPSNRPR